MRLDQYLSQNGSFPTRSKATLAIKEKKVKVNGKTITKAGYEVTGEETFTIEKDECQFVSRGGYKLLGAIDTFGIDLKGKTVLDIGASTGGFTDCALQHGAKKVYAYDVGSDQLHPTLLSNPTVISKEKVNARYLTHDDFEEEIDFICMDVSFISCTKILAAIADILSSKKCAVILFKPQFEVGSKYLNGHGIVTSAKMVEEKKEECILYAKSLNLQLRGEMISPIKGGDGNTEYLLYFEKQ